MTQLSALYQDVILEHNRAPRNFRRMDDADRHAEGRNPLCGDQITVWLKLDGEVISDVSFDGSGCAISKASASLMTAAVKGKTRAEVAALFGRFRELVTGETAEEARGGAGQAGGLLGDRGVSGAGQVRNAVMARAQSGAGQRS